LAQPYVGEIKMFAGTFAPVGWMLCQGQTLPISENETLFQLIGTTYGGDGEETFCLPNLSSRLPMHAGQSNQLGESGGVETVTLTTKEMPAHSHPFLGSSNTATLTTPSNSVVATPTVVDLYRNGDANTAMAGCIPAVGGSQPHDNLQPYVCINYIISLFGIFPSPT
jgi:microcystin-dependent protein